MPNMPCAYSGGTCKASTEAALREGVQMLECEILEVEADLITLTSYVPEFSCMF